MTGMQHYYTDGEATLIYLTAVFRYQLAAPSTELRKELDDCPWLHSVTARHSTGSIALRWTDFRTAVTADLKPTRGARLPQVRRIVEDWQWLTGLPLREDLIPEAA